MKKLLSAFILVLSFDSFAVTVSDDLARNLLNALYNSGIKISKTQTGIETELVKEIKCFGSYEHEISDGLLSKIKCYRGEVSLDESTHLSNTLELAGAEVDAAMGKWWVYASDIKCFTIDGEDLSYTCSFK